MKPFTLLIKPASADCNLRCEYCFYLDRSRLYPEQNIHRMPDDVLESMISSYMATPQTQYVFSWQGGEPSLMGLNFFRRAIELQKKYGRNGSVVANSLQTNATLITDEFAEFMAEYSFLAGVSIDGPDSLHDQYRKNIAGDGSHNRVLEGIEALNRNKVEFNALTLVSASNVHHGREVYRYLRDMGILYHQYIPCVEFDSSGNPLPWTISAEEWGNFLCAVFDEWMIRDTRKVSVRLFDAIIILMVDGYRTLCHLENNCCNYLVVEHNGDVYPCDFFVNAELKLGNVQTDSWESMQDSELYRSFGAQKTQWAAKCSACEFRDLCLGDCLKHRIGDEGKIERLSWLCEGWKMFFKHSLSGLRRLAREVISDRRMIMGAENITSDAPYSGVGRNDPCPCGSGKKFKKCHGAQG